MKKSLIGAIVVGIALVVIITTMASTSQNTELPTTENTELPTTENTELPTTENTELPTTENTELPTTENATGKVIVVNISDGIGMGDK